MLGGGALKILLLLPTTRLPRDLFEYAPHFNQHFALPTIFPMAIACRNGVWMLRRLRVELCRRLLFFVLPEAFLQTLLTPYCPFALRGCLLPSRPPLARRGCQSSFALLSVLCACRLLSHACHGCQSSFALLSVLRACRLSSSHAFCGCLPPFCPSCSSRLFFRRAPLFLSRLFR